MVGVDHTHDTVELSITLWRGGREGMHDLVGLLTNSVLEEFKNRKVMPSACWLQPG